MSEVTTLFFRHEVLFSCCFGCYKSFNLQFNLHQIFCSLENIYKHFHTTYQHRHIATNTCISAGIYVIVLVAMHQCWQLCISVGSYASVLVAMYQCQQLCISVGSYVLVLVAMHQCWYLCTSVGSYVLLYQCWQLCLGYSKRTGGYPLSPHIKTVAAAFLRAE